MATASPEKRLIEHVRNNKQPDRALAKACDPLVVQFTAVNPFVVNKALHHVHRANGHTPTVGPFRSVDAAAKAYRRYRDHIQAGGRAHLYRLAWETRKFIPDEPAPLSDSRLWDAYNKVFCESVLFKSILCRQVISCTTWVPEVPYTLTAFLDQRKANRAYMTAFRRLLPTIGTSFQLAAVLSDEQGPASLRIVKEHRREHFLRRFVTDVDQLRRKVYGRRDDLRTLWEEVGRDFEQSPDILSS